MLPIASIGTVLVASLASLSLGLDVGMISSTVVQPSFIEYLGTPSSSEIGGIVSSFSAGACLGAFGCAFIGDRFGRVKGMFIGSLVVLLGCGLQAGAHNVGMLIAGRLITGLGAGNLTALFPVYASEISPPKIRGALGALQMVGIETAIFLATAIGYSFGQKTGNIQWRGPLALQALPVGILAVVVLFLPETPRFLMAKGREEKAMQILIKLHGNQGPEFVEREYQEIRDQIRAEKETQEPGWLEILRKKSYRKRMLLVTGLQWFTQLTGINCIQYYAATIYLKLGFSQHESLMLNLIYGAFGLIFTLLWLSLIDRVGRKPLLIIASIGMGSALLVQSVLSAVYVNKEPANTNALNAQVAMFFVFNLFFTAPGMIAWLMPPEMLPMQIRAKGNSISVSMNNIAGIVVAQMSPSALDAIGFKFFYVFVACDIVACLCYAFFYPETKSLTLEQMDALFGDQITQHALNPELGGDKIAAPNDVFVDNVRDDEPKSED